MWVLSSLAALHAAVDAAFAGAAVAVGFFDGALEHVVLLGRGVGLVHTEQRAQVDDKALCGGQFAGGDALPAGDEVFCGQSAVP